MLSFVDRHPCYYQVPIAYKYNPPIYTHMYWQNGVTGEADRRRLVYVAPSPPPSTLRVLIPGGVPGG